MVDELVKYETSVLAKEKGIIINSRGRFVYNIHIKKYLSYPFYGEGEINKMDIYQPAQSLLQKWLREKHSIEIKIWAEYYLTGINWNVQALKFNLSKKYQHLGFIEDGTMIYGDNGEYDSYEKALEKGLELGLNLIK